MQNIHTQRTSSSHQLQKKRKFQWGTEASKFFSCLFCSYCGVTGNGLSDHYVVSHRIEVCFHQLNFNTYDDFKVWRIYSLSQSTYMTEWPTNNEGLECNTCILYAWCKEGARFRMSPVNMFRGCCPASVRAGCKNDGTIIVEYISTHLGHARDINEVKLHDQLQTTGELKVGNEEQKQYIDLLEFGSVKIEQVTFCTLDDTNSKIHEADTISVKVEEDSCDFDSFQEPSANTNVASSCVKDEAQYYSVGTQLSLFDSRNDPTLEKYHFSSFCSKNEEQNCPNESQPPVSDSRNDLIQEPNSSSCDPPEIRQVNSMSIKLEDANSKNSYADSEFNTPISILPKQCVSPNTDKLISSSLGSTKDPPALDSFILEKKVVHQPPSNRRVSERLRLKSLRREKRSENDLEKLPKEVKTTKKLPLVARESNTVGECYICPESTTKYQNSLSNDCNSASFVKDNIGNKQTIIKPRLFPKPRCSVSSQTPLVLPYYPGPKPVRSSLDSDLPRKCYSNKKKSNISLSDQKFNISSSDPPRKCYTNKKKSNISVSNTLPAEELTNKNANDSIPFHKPPEKECGITTTINGLLDHQVLSTCFIENTSNQGEVMLDAPIGLIEPSSLMYQFDEDVFTLAEDNQLSDVSSTNDDLNHSRQQYETDEVLRAKQRIRNHLLGRNRGSNLKIKRMYTYESVTPSKTDNEETNEQAGDLPPKPNRSSSLAIQSSTVSSHNGIDTSFETKNFIKPMKAYHNVSMHAARRKQIFEVNNLDIPRRRHPRCSTSRSITSCQEINKTPVFITGTDLL